MTLLNKVSIACTTPVSMDVSVKLFRVVCLMMEFFDIFNTNKAGVNGMHVPVRVLNHTNTCIIPENPITAWRSWSDSQTSSDLFSCPARVLMLSATCFIILRHALIIVQLPEPWQKMRVFWSFDELIVGKLEQVETFLLSFEHNVRLSSNNPKHYNVRHQDTYQLLRKPPSLCIPSPAWHLSLTLAR